MDLWSMGGLGETSSLGREARNQGMALSVYGWGGLLERKEGIVHGRKSKKTPTR